MKATSLHIFLHFFLYFQLTSILITHYAKLSAIPQSVKLKFIYFDHLAFIVDFLLLDYTFDYMDMVSYGILVQ